MPDELAGTSKSVVASTKVDDERGRLTTKVAGLSLARSHSPVLRILLIPSISSHLLWMTATFAEYLLHVPIAYVSAHSWLVCINHSSVVRTSNDRSQGYRTTCLSGETSARTTTLTRSTALVLRRMTCVCQSHAQNANYTGWCTVIETYAGDTLFFAYFFNKAGSAATKHCVYWNGYPGVEFEKPSQLTKERLVDGNLMDSDDRNCRQSYADGDFKHCVDSFTIQKGTTTGTYSMVWWWTSFTPDDRMNGCDGAGGAAYSSFFNVIVMRTAVGSDAVLGEADEREGASYTSLPVVYAAPADSTKTTARQLAKCGTADEAKYPITDTPDKNSMPPVYKPAAFEQ